MKKEIIKPFDLEKAKAGAKLRTRNGYPVEILKWDARGEYPIVGIIKQEEQDDIEGWTCEGLWSINNPSCVSDLVDLVIVEEVEESEFWSDDVKNTFNGFYINSDADIIGVRPLPNISNNYNVFATEKQAKSALAMARISQIMANDIETFGGVVTDEEWDNNKWKFVICRKERMICSTTVTHDYHLLAFHKSDQRALFLEKYPQLVKDYLMIPY